jgi:hypothetical protein
VRRREGPTLSFLGFRDKVRSAWTRRMAWHVLRGCLLMQQRRRSLLPAAAVKAAGPCNPPLRCAPRNTRARTHMHTWCAAQDHDSLAAFCSGTLGHQLTNQDLAIAGAPCVCVCVLACVCVCVCVRVRWLPQPRQQQH